MTDKLQHLRDLLAQAYPDAPISLSLAEQRKVQRRLYLRLINNLPTLLAIAEAARDVIASRMVAEYHHDAFDGDAVDALETALAKLEKP